MSYIKLCQIVDHSGEQYADGEHYIESADGVAIRSSGLSFPLQVSVEVMDFGTEEGFSKRGALSSSAVEIVTVADLSSSIRQSVFNQLVVKYPSLVI